MRKIVWNRLPIKSNLLIDSTASSLSNLTALVDLNVYSELVGITRSLLCSNPALLLLLAFCKPEGSMYCSKAVCWLIFMFYRKQSNDSKITLIGTSGDRADIFGASRKCLKCKCLDLACCARVRWILEQYAIKTTQITPVVLYLTNFGSIKCH